MVHGVTKSQKLLKWLSMHAIRDRAKSLLKAARFAECEGEKESSVYNQ